MVHAVPRFRHFQLVAMWPANIIDPGSFIQPNRVDNQSIVVHPFANRISVPAGLQDLFRELSPVRPDVSPYLVILVNDLDLVFVVPNLYCSEVKKLKTRETDR